MFRCDPNPGVVPQFAIDSCLHHVFEGHTFCTIEQFDEVSKALAECTFTVSDLPVLLSLEMHCSPKMQHTLAMSMMARLGYYLLPVRLCLKRDTCLAAQLSK